MNKRRRKFEFWDRPGLALMVVLAAVIIAAGMAAGIPFEVGATAAIPMCMGLWFLISEIRYTQFAEIMEGETE